MKTIALSIVILIFGLFSLSAQTQNINPDSNGEPWIVGGFRVPLQEEIEAIPEKNYQQVNKLYVLPDMLDNTEEPYFRPIFSQTDGSCAQASGVGYTYTYEINRLRNLPSDVSENQYPTHYTYNFLNGGSGGNGSWMNDGWEIIRASGIPNVDVYGGLAQNAAYWMSGYADYAAGHENRVQEVFSIFVGEPEGLETLKYYLYDHLEGSDVGGIVTFAAGIGNENFQQDGDIIVSWGNSVNHAMTIVGWDDNVEYDFNNDGQITNDIDINGDNTVDMRDWERGAVIMVNSWGLGWGNQGKAYIMYKLLAEPIENGGIMSSKVFGVLPKMTAESILSAKAKMNHSSREKIKLSFGIANDPAATQPDEILNFPLFNYQGGDFYMRGTSTDPIELALDITPLLTYAETGSEAAYFLIVDEQDPMSWGGGEIIDFSVIDNNGNEWISETHNLSITNDGQTIVKLIAAPVFDAPEITTESIPTGYVGHLTEFQMEAEGGSVPYTWSLSQNYEEQAYTASYSAITSNQLTPNNNDDGYAAQTLPFEFPFFGEIYDQVYISTDGSVLFEEGFLYLRTEEAVQANKMIAVFASDLYITEGSDDGLFYEGDANSATFRWKTGLFGDETANVDASVTLYPDGQIDVQYGENITPGIAWASGISNGEGSYVIAELSGAYDPSEDGYAMIPEPFPYGMNITPEGLFSGVVTESGSWDIHFKITDNNAVSSEKILTYTTEVSGVAELQTGISVAVYPSVTNTATTIHFELAKRGNLQLSVYDAAGKRVKSLYSGVFSAGQYQFPLDVTEFNAGMYFIHIETEFGSEISKLIVK